MQRGSWAKCNVSCNSTNKSDLKTVCKHMWFMWVCHKGVSPRIRGIIMVSNQLSSWIARGLSFTYKKKIPRQDKDPEWNSIWQGRKEQHLLTQQLHQRASVQEGLCGIPEVDKFQKVIDNYQIIVLSAKLFNTIVYKRPRREKQIYLYHYVNHFNIITSVSSFLGRSYWCLECMKGYNEKEKHR